MLFYAQAATLRGTGSGKTMTVAKALAKTAGSSLALMVLLVNGETTSAPDVVGRTGEECLVLQGLPLQVQLNNGASGKCRA